MQGARNWRSRHGKNVHFLAHLFQAFFVTDTETLLLVDDDKTEVGELDVF